MTAAKLPPTTVALAGASLQVGGTVGALVLCWWLQKHRFLAVAIMFVSRCRWSAPSAMPA